MCNSDCFIMESLFYVTPEQETKTSVDRSREKKYVKKIHRLKLLYCSDSVNLFQALGNRTNIEEN